MFDSQHPALAPVRAECGNLDPVKLGRIVFDKSWNRSLSAEDQAVWDYLAANGGGWTLKCAGDAYDEHLAEQERRKLRATGGTLTTETHHWRDGRREVTRTVERFAAPTRRPCSRVASRSRERRAAPARRSGASSRTSSTDPGGSDPHEPSAVRLRLAPSRAVLTFGCLTAEQHGEGTS